MRRLFLLALTLGVTSLGVGCCCHHARSKGCYDPNTGLVHKRGMFDNCSTGQCNSCDNAWDGKSEPWYDGDCNDCRQKKSKNKDRKCRHASHDDDDDCSCKKSRQHSNCDCNECCDPCGQYGYDNGALIPYEGSYTDNGMIYDGQAIYDGQYDPNCPTCNSTSPNPTYAPNSYPELMVPQQQQNQKPMPAPAAEPLPMQETSITIPPASYVVPQPINGPQFPRLQRVSAH